LKNRFYITTPIYYVNDKPHIGHAYTTVAADVLVRYNRIFGREAFFLTGTDEHGQKLQDTATSRGIPPKEYCDEIVTRFLDTWKRLNISYDDFIRTTQQRHIEVVLHILGKLYDEGEIYKSSYEGWYCKYEERFWTEKDLADGNCPDCGRPVSRISEDNYFFKMSKYQDWLIDYIESNPNFIRPEHRKNEILGYLKKKLGDLCISRPKSRLSWGIGLPFDRDYVCYVWFDALINYISAIGYLSDENKFNKWWPNAVHLIGKDILTTHAVYWPIMLKAMGIPMPKTIFAHGWWLKDDTKMSKSLGNVVNPLDLAELYGVDAFRYFLMREMTMGQDSSYSEQSFVSRYNSDLANDFGNLISRLTKMISSYENGKLPKVSEMESQDKEIKQKSIELQKKVKSLVDEFKINSAIEEILQLIRMLNRYIEKNRPWDLYKSENRERLGTILYTASEGLKSAARLLYPIMPGKIEEFSKIFNSQIEELISERAADWGWLLPGMEVKPGKALFPRIDVSKISKQLTKATPEERKTAEFIDLSDFAKLKFRVAKILSAEAIAGADKLLKLQIDLGSEKRQIVAGIAEHYTPEDLIGKSIIVLTNLKPAKIRGVESNGMLLAAKNKGEMVLLTADGDISPGSKIS